jgi:hypothetical protein
MTSHYQFLLRMIFRCVLVVSLWHPGLWILTYHGLKPKSKAKVQSLGTSQPASNVSVAGQHDELVNKFCYIFSIIDLSGRCRPDMMRSSVSRAQPWTPFLRCGPPAALYGSGTWNMLWADIVACKSLIVAFWGVKWQDKIISVTIAEKTGLLPITEHSQQSALCPVRSRSKA